MTDAEILEMTFFDTATCIRKVKVKDKNTGVSKFEDVIIFENMKCALSKKEQAAPLLDGEVGSIVSTHKLFINPLADIQLGDNLVVTNGMGQKCIYLASEPFYYQSHREIPVTKKVRS